MQERDVVVLIAVVLIAAVLIVLAMFLTTVWPVSAATSCLPC